MATSVHKHIAQLHLAAVVDFILHIAPVVKNFAATMLLHPALPVPLFVLLQLLVLMLNVVLVAAPIVLL